MDYPNRVTFYDTPLPDGSVERVYSNGVRERRLLQGPGIIAWSDSRGKQGRDIYLGAGRIRREEYNGAVSEGQQAGYGVTVWNSGQFISVNQTALPEPPLPGPPPAPRGLGGLLLGTGLGALFGFSAANNGPYATDPRSAEYALYAEEQARQQAMRRRQEGSGDGGGADGDDGYFFYGSYGGSSGGWSDNSGAGGADWGGSDSFG